VQPNPAQDSQDSGNVAVGQTALDAELIFERGG
jgi:hypothetical protein